MPIANSPIIAVLACAGAVFWPGAFVFGFPGVLRQYWQQSFGAGGAPIGGVIFFILTGAACFMYLCGRLQEKYRPGRLVATGILISGGSSLLLSQAGSMAAVNLWAFCAGAASSFVYLPGLTVVQRWLPRRRGLAAGFFNMAFGLSAAVMAPVFSTVLSKWGYAPLTIVAGCGALVMGLAASTMIRLPHADTARRQDSGLGSMPSRTAGEALRSRAFWFIWLTWMFAGAAGASMLVLSTGFGLARGLGLAQAVFLLTAFNLTNGIGRLISGYFSDRLGRSRTIAVSFIGASLAYLVLPHLTSPWVWAMLTAVIGFAFGTLFAVSGPLAGDCFGMAHFGTIFGFIFTAYGFVSGPLGPWLSGYILDVTHGNYTLVFSYLGMMYLAAAGLILFVQPWHEYRPHETLPSPSGPMD